MPLIDSVPPIDAVGARSGSILFICTGNICRSAYAERFLANLLPAGEFTVSSAGTGAVVGAGIHPSSIEMLRVRGIDGDDHAGRQLTKELAISADLILAMTREHRSAVVKVEPAALRKTYTVPEAARLLPFLDGEPQGSGPDRLLWLASQLRLARGRFAASDADDVPDPIGMPMSAFEEMADMLDPDLTSLAAVISAG